ncbi:hypothetical protein M9Y10_026609 [Tritrichomonas musculus]|uniref:Uncharacterized protein n=1 Tax=Tritrichomonas musculus TaxID=1915356 RepID=A0ABR2H623_9EUKA
MLMSFVPRTIEEIVAYQEEGVFFRSELSNDEMIKKEKLFRCLNGLPDDAFQKKPQPIQKRYILVLTKLMWAIIKG